MKSKIKKRLLLNESVCVWLQSRVYLGMPTLKDLILKRPSRQFQYLHVLLDLSSHEKEKVCFFLYTFSSSAYSFLSSLQCPCNKSASVCRRSAQPL